MACTIGMYRFYRTNENRGILKFMITSEEAWNEIAKIIKNIMERLRSDEERNRNMNPLCQKRKGK